jgi:uncharacterized protein (DUF4415 family)
MAKLKPLIDDDGEVRELTTADLKRMRPAAEVHSPEFLDNWEKNRQRKLNENGNPIGRPPKEKPKVPVTMRLDAEVVEYFRAGGVRWQTRLNAFLAAHVKRAGKGAGGKRAKPKT